jgi:repressor of nif and glnA expression
MTNSPLKRFVMEILGDNQLSSRAIHVELKRLGYSVELNSLRGSLKQMAKVGCLTTTRRTCPCCGRQETMYEVKS